MRVSEQQLLKSIKAGETARVYLLYGEEDFLIRMYTEKLIDLAVPAEYCEMNFLKYSLTAKVNDKKLPPPEDCPPKVEELSDFVESMPFFAERKCVLLKNLDTELLEKDELDDYIALLSELPEESVVIITRENTESDPKKFKDKLGRAKMKKLIAAVEKCGVVCELEQFPTKKLMGMAVRKCAAAGCVLSEENAAYLAERTGGSLTLLQTETEKLCAYRQSGEITREDIEKLVPKRLEEDIYSLARELFAGRTDRALEIMNAQFANRVDPIIIMSALSGFFVDLYRARLGLDAGKKYQEAAEQFNYKNRSFVLRNAYGTAKNLSESYLGGCVAILYNANRLLNSSRADRRTIIERTLVEIANYG